MAATSEEFKAALKEGRIVDALKTALGQSIELEITTTIASSNPESGSQAREKGDSSQIMRTRLNIVEGKIETEIGSKFLEGEKFAELRDFHVSQMQASGQIIERNISSLQKLLELWVGMTQQTVAAQDGKTHSPELKSIQPDAIAPGSSTRSAAWSEPDLGAHPEEPVTSPVSSNTETEDSLPTNADDDAEVMAAFQLDGSADDLASVTEAPETAAPSAEKDAGGNSALKTAAVAAGTAAVVGMAAAAAAAWGSREDETAPESDLSESEASENLDLEEGTTDGMSEELETSPDLASTWEESDLTDSEASENLALDDETTDGLDSELEASPDLASTWDESDLSSSEASENIALDDDTTDGLDEELETPPDLASTWDETELLETPPSEEPVAFEETATDGDPDTFVESMESDPLADLGMMDGTQQLASSWDDTELLADEPEPEPMAPDPLAETLVEPAMEDEPVIEDSEVEIMGALETEASGSTEIKEDETAEILGALETEQELESSWEDEPELPSDTEAESLALGIDDEASADLMGTGEEELAVSWEEPETSWEADSTAEWPTVLEDDPAAASSAGQQDEWESNEDLDFLGEEGETGEEAMAVPNEEIDEYALPMDGDDEALADVFGSSGMEVAEELEVDESASPEELDSLWDSSETPETQAPELLEMPEGDDDALGINEMEQNQELENLWGESAALAESQELELPSESNPFDDDDDAALMSVFDNDGDADAGFDEPQPYPGTTGADLGGEDLDDAFSSAASQTAEETPGSMFDTEESDLDDFDADMFGEQPQMWDSSQSNGTKATATTKDDSSYDEESDDPLAALLANTNDAPAPASDFESEEEFDPLAELFAESDEESDINSGGEEADDLDSLFDDDVNVGNLEDPFADLELVESPSSQQSKKKR
ncbi:MAG: hypothetical protein AB4352_19950 [Hormoscilla sp.]